MSVPSIPTTALAGTPTAPAGAGPNRVAEATRPAVAFDALEEDDDVQTVWGNYDVPEEELEKLA